MKKAFVFSMIITLFQFVAAAVLFFYLPEQIPIHWNVVNGEVDGFAGRGFIFFAPVISLAVTLIMHYLPRFAPKGENIEKSGKLFPIIMVMLSLMMAVILVITATAAFGLSVPISEIVLGLLGIMMLFIGNYLPKTKPNYAIGIRLPWTLRNEATWTKTHRIGGWIFFVIGLLFIGGIFLAAPLNLIVPFSGLLVGMLVITGYACQTYRKTQGQ